MREFLTSGQVGKIELNEQKRIRQEISNRWAALGMTDGLKGVVKEEDLDALSADAFADACRPGNPRETSVEEIKELYLSLM